MVAALVAILLALPASADIVRLDETTVAFTEDATCHISPDDYGEFFNRGNTAGIGVGIDGLRVPVAYDVWQPCATLGKRFNWQRLQIRKTSHPDSPASLDWLALIGPDKHWGVFNGVNDDADNIPYGGVWIWQHTMPMPGASMATPWTVRDDNPERQALYEADPVTYARQNHSWFSTRWSYQASYDIQSRGPSNASRNGRDPISFAFDTPVEAVYFSLRRTKNGNAVYGSDPLHDAGIFRSIRVRAWDESGTPILKGQWGTDYSLMLYHWPGDPPSFEVLLGEVDGSGDRIKYLQVDSPGGSQVWMNDIRVGTTNGSPSDEVEPRECDVTLPAPYGSDNCVGNTPSGVFSCTFKDVLVNPTLHDDRDGDGMHLGDGPYGPHPERNALGQPIEEFQNGNCGCNPDPMCGVYRKGDFNKDGAVNASDAPLFFDHLNGGL